MMNPERIETARILGEQIRRSDRNLDAVLTEIKAQHTPEEVTDAYNYICAKDIKRVCETITETIAKKAALEFLDYDEVLDFYRWCTVMMTLAKIKISGHRAPRSAKIDRKPRVTSAGRRSHGKYEFESIHDRRRYREKL